MSRLIDADKLPLEPKEANQFIPYEYASGWNDMLLNVLKAEQIDAAPVVRCGECEHHYWEQEPCHGKSVHYCKLPHMRGIEVFKEFFCYYGKREEGPNNGN